MNEVSTELLTKRLSHVKYFIKTSLHYCCCFIIIIVAGLRELNLFQVIELVGGRLEFTPTSLELQSSFPSHSPTLPFLCQLTHKGWNSSSSQYGEDLGFPVLEKRRNLNL